LYVIDNDVKVNSFRYICGKEFVLDDVYESLNHDNKKIGIIIMDNKSLTIGELIGTEIIIRYEKESYIPSKHRQGGQSSQRFQRLRDEACNRFYKKIDQKLSNIFGDRLNEIEYFILGGSGHTKYEYKSKSSLNVSFIEKIKFIVDICYDGYSGIRESLLKLEEEMKDMEYFKERKEIQKIYNKIMKEDKDVIYGYNEIYKLITEKRVSKIIIGENNEKIKELLNLKEIYNFDILTVSENTEEGFNFIKTFEIGAYLYY